jgi:ribosomal protein S3
MSRIGNLTTLRIGFTQNWKSNWYEGVSPSILLFQDLKIRDYLSGIFYKLKAPTSYYHVTWISASMLMIRWEVYWNRSFRLNNFLFRNYLLKSNAFWKMFYLEDKYLKILSSLVYLSTKKKTEYNSSVIRSWIINAGWNSFMEKLYIQEQIWVMVYLGNERTYSIHKLPEYIIRKWSILQPVEDIVIKRGDILKWTMTSIYRKIEQSIEKYVEQHVFCLVHSYMWKKPAISNAKMVADYVMYTLENGWHFKKIFEKLKKWQKKNYYRGRLKTKNKRSTRLMRLDAAKRTNCLGIKIECVGTAKKGRRAKLTAYSDWIRDPRYTHKMPNNTFCADIDYYQTYAVKRSSTVGIKVWVFLRSIINNQSKRYVSMLV